MTHDTTTAADDLAFLRGLVDSPDGGPVWRFTGKVFAVGGLLYGAQCVYHWAQIQGLVLPDTLALAALIAPTALFLVWLAVELIRSGHSLRPQGSSNRSMSAIFSATGMVNLVLLVIFAPPAIQSGDFRVWLFYPAVVFALQGGAWYAAFQIRRKLWMLATALGWMVAAGGMGLTRGEPVYVLICGAALFLCMMLPGLVMMRRKDA